MDQGDKVTFSIIHLLGARSYAMTEKVLKTITGVPDRPLQIGVKSDMARSSSGTGAATV